MMEMLMRSPRKLISSEHFMDRIWGYESETEQKGHENILKKMLTDQIKFDTIKLFQIETEMVALQVTQFQNQRLP